MNKHGLIFIFGVAVILMSSAPGKASEGFYYQAAIRDAAGKLLNQQDITLKVSIRSSSLDGAIVYSETHRVETNPYGIVNLHISEGNVLAGNFSAINWGTINYFLELEADDSNTGNYESMGTSQILSVPMANYAHMAGNVDTKDTIATNELQYLSYQNDSLILDKTNSKVHMPGSSWFKKNDITYIDDSSVVIGSDSLIKGGGEEVKLTLQANNNQSLLGYGDLRLLKSTNKVLSTTIDCDVYANLNTTTSLEDYGRAVGVYGLVNELRLINNYRTSISGVAGGVFDLHMNGLNFGDDPNKYRLAGAEAKIMGTITEHHDSAIIAGLIALDEVNAERTYAGYFGGKAYVSDNFGIGVLQPQRKLHVNGAIRLNGLDNAPSSPAFGDIFVDNVTQGLLFYDGSEWDTLNNNSGAGENPWEVSGDVTYISSGAVALGTETLTYPSTRLELYNAVGDGENRNLYSLSFTNSSKINGHIISALGTSRGDGTWAAGIGVYGAVSPLNRIGNTAGWESGSAGGSFTMNCQSLSFDDPGGTYRVVGMETKLLGSLGVVPANATLSALYAHDGINSSATYAAYIRGKMYITGAVGIGVEQPERALHINDVMRLEPRTTEPSGAQEGDIYYDSNAGTLRLYDGTQWRNIAFTP